MAEYQFRKAVVGGFNCEDVMGFVTGMAEKHQAELAQQQEKNQALEEELAQKREQADRLHEQLEQTAREREEWKARAEQAQAELKQGESAGEQKAQVLTQTQEELARTKSALEQARAEIARLKDEVERLTPAAEAYAAVKERTASIEFEAHRRAQNVESRAKIAAGDTLRQAEQWMAKLEEQYDILKAGIEASAAQARGHIAAAGEGLEQVARIMEEQKAALKAVSDSCAESLRGKKAE